MRFLYTFLTRIVSVVLPFVALFVPKIKLFVMGRKNTFEIIKQKRNSNQPAIWLHAASLGEYEQGLPVLEKLKQKFPNHQIVLTFFSPSGFEIRKNNPIADITVYLPLDLPDRVTHFLDLVRPEMVFFVKYEFWPNYLTALQKRQIPTYLVSGIFRDNQLFFKWYGGFYRKALLAFTTFFLQNETSKTLLESIGFDNAMVTGDTRFDRVLHILEQDNRLEYIEKFKNNQPALVVGSSWPQDETLLSTYINACGNSVKFIIAPHNIKPDQVLQLKQQITKKVLLFSEKDKVTNFAEYDVFIIDTIGILTKIYSYADVAYVGGGFGTGIHNILEPATFGVPIVIGPNYKRFAEAVDLIALGGCEVITSQNELNVVLDAYFENSELRKEKGLISENFVAINKDATLKIIEGLTFGV